MITSKEWAEIDRLIFEAHQEGMEQVIEQSIRTGIPLVIAENGVIKKLKPKYKYILVPIQKKRRKKRQKLAES